MTVSTFPTQLANVIAAARANIATWTPFRNYLNSYLNIDYNIQNPGGTYEASNATIIADYALGYQVETALGNTATANSYAYRAQGVMANIVGSSFAPLPAYQRGIWIGFQFLGIGDGATKKFTLPTGIVPIGGAAPSGSLSVWQYASDTAPSTTGTPFGGMFRSSGNVDVDTTTALLDSLIAKVQLTNAPFTVYTQSTDGVTGDYCRPSDQTPDAILWLPGKGPAAGTQYTVTRIFAASASASGGVTYSAADNSVNFATAPASGMGLMFSCLYNISGGAQYVYTSFGDGGCPNNGQPAGFNSILIDGPGYTGRYLGKYLAWGLDWLDGWANLDATLRANTISYLKAIFNWSVGANYTTGNGYKYNTIASNYGCGFYASSVLSAIALVNPNGSTRDAYGATMKSAVLNFRTNNVLPILTNATISVYGGWWAEGWAYGPQAVEDIHVGAYAMEQVGWATVTAERALAGQQSDSLITHAITVGSSPTVCGDGDTFSFPQPFPDTANAGGCLLTVLASMAATVNSAAASRAVYVISNWTGISELLNATYMVFNQSLPAAAANLNGLAQFRLDTGTGHYAFRTGLTFSSDVVVFGMCGNLINCDHQTFSPSKVSVYRGQRCLLCDGNNVVTNENPSTKSQYTNTLVVDANGNTNIQTYRYCMGSWYGSPGVSITGIDTDNATYASVVESFPTAYAPASPGNGSGGPCQSLVRQKVFVPKSSTAAYLVIYDRVTTSDATFLKRPTWLTVGTWSTPAAVTNGYSFNTTVTDAKIFGQTLSSQALTATGPSTPLSGVSSVAFNNATAIGGLSYISIFQVDASTVSAPDTMKRLLSADGLSEGAIAGTNALLFCTTPTGVSYNTAIQGTATNYVFGMTPNAAYTVNGAPITANQYGTLVFNSTGPVLIAQPAATPLLLAIADDSMWFDVVGARW